MEVPELGTQMGMRARLERPESLTVTPFLVWGGQLPVGGPAGKAFVIAGGQA